jgi:hypothetical protein
MKPAAILLSLVVFLPFSCVEVEKEQESRVSNVSFTPCRQDNLRSSGFSDKADVEFTGEGIQITHYHLEVTCDFTTVDVAYTLVNGVLNITEQSSPNQAKCICHTDVSYTINGISKAEINVIFINGVQVYCYNENYPAEIQTTDFSLPEGCTWKSHTERGEVYVIRSIEDILPFIDGEFPESLIDFGKYSLIYARGIGTSGIDDITKQLQQVSENEYLLYVEITNNDTEIAPLWNIAILIPAVPGNAVVELNVNVFPKNVDWVQVAQGELHGVGEEGFSRESVVIKTDSEWEAFKQKINRTNNVVDTYFTEKEIDFSTYQIIAVFDEVKGNGGWSIDITGITEWRDKIAVSVTNLKKGNASRVITQPFQLVKIPVSEKEIEYEYDLAEGVDVNPDISLTGTKWKLTGFANVTNGITKTPEPDSENHYWIIFNDDNTISGKSSTNELVGSYEVNYETATLRITNFGGTKIGEILDGELFMKNLQSVYYFSMQETSLRLYYHEKDYLLFNNIQP